MNRPFAAQAENLEDALHSMLRDNLLNLPYECLHDGDEFRRTVLYTEEVDRELLKHKKVLRDLYDVYSATSPTAGRNNFRPQEWALFLEVGGVFSHAFSKVDALRAFIFARMRHLDETQPRFRSLSWVSFLEAVVRVAAFAPCPGEAQMKEFKATQLTDFYESLTHSIDLAGSDGIAKIRSCLADDDARPVHERLALLLTSLLQNHAIKYRCLMKTKTHTLKLNYLTEKQKQRWLTVNATRTRRAVWNSTAGYGRPHQTSEIPSSVKSKSIRLTFGRLFPSGRDLEVWIRFVCISIQI